MSLINIAFMSQVYPAGPQTLKMFILNCLFLRSCTAWKLPSNFISLETTAFVQLKEKCHIHTANFSRQRSYLDCVGYACRSLYLWSSLQLKWNRSPFMDQSLSVVGMWGSCVRESTACCSTKQAIFYNTETHYEGIITQKHFVKKRNWTFRYINFLSNIF
jgi:hypothetical protein